MMLVIPQKLLTVAIPDGALVTRQQLATMGASYERSSTGFAASGWLANSEQLRYDICLLVLFFFPFNLYKCISRCH